MACDDDAAPARRVVGQPQVFGCQACGGAGGVEGGGVGVGADGADVEDRGRGEEVLCAAGGVLGGAAGDERGGAGLEVGVEGEVVRGGEDGVVGFERVFGEEGRVAGGWRGGSMMGLREDKLGVERGWVGGGERMGWGWSWTYPSAWMSSSGFSRQRSLYGGAICATMGGDWGNSRGYLTDNGFE